jgi:O-antigen/teichoic acid export membrane protein
MAISFYASRVILQQLGVVDYGVYNIVGGLVVLFNFFNYALSSSMQRYISFELGRNNRINSVFSACCACSLVLIAFLVLLAESVGYWFLNSVISIPAGKLADAQIVYHISVFSVVMELLRLPYNALIIAKERMSFYAYNSIIEAILKLLVVLSLSLIVGNKLIIYAVLIATVAIIINCSYYLYCHHHFSDVRFSIRTKLQDFKEIAKFTSWNLISSISDIGYMYGTNIVLNIFYGVTLNATMGITNQVKSAVFSFSRNIQVAANPQIVKQYANCEYDGYGDLVIWISKLSFFLMFIIGVPLFLNIDTVLNIWLVNIPPMADLFIRLVIIFCLIDSLTGPLWTAMQATGNIRNYQIITSLILLLNLPGTYFAFKLGCAPWYMLLIQIFINAVLILVRLVFAKKYCYISFSKYSKKVILPIIKVCLCGLFLPLISNHFFSGIPGLIITTIVSTISILCAAYFLGISYQEREKVNNIIAKKFFKSKSTT